MAVSINAAVAICALLHFLGNAEVLAFTLTGGRHHVDRRQCAYVDAGALFLRGVVIARLVR